MLGSLYRPVAACGGLWRPVAADWIPYKKHFRRTGGLDLKSWCLDAWVLAGLKGFEEVAHRWEEGIGRTEDLRTSHTLDDLGGRRIYCIFMDLTYFNVSLRIFNLIYHISYDMLT